MRRPSLFLDSGSPVMIMLLFGLTLRHEMKEVPRVTRYACLYVSMLALLVSVIGCGKQDSADSGTSTPPANRTDADKAPDNAEHQTPSQAAVPTSQPAVAQEASANPRVLMETSHGNIVIELDADRTPITVKNFLQYVDDRFYDGTIFHRTVLKGPASSIGVIQGGGFTERLAPKPTRPPIKNESSLARSGLRGTIAMARSDHPDSATCQFYINVVDNPGLDALNGGYCTFGSVIEGMDVVDRIAAIPTVNRGALFTNLPGETVLIKSVRRK